jgi:hypothetical protein
MKLEHFAPAAKFFIGGHVGRFFPQEEMQTIRASDQGRSKGAKQNSDKRKSTTTDRHGTKISTTFCDFLLTGNSRPTILQLQIRGNVVSARRTGSRMLYLSVRATKPARVLSKKNRARRPAPRPLRSVKRCCEGCVISPAHGRALRLQRLSASRPQARSNFLLCDPHEPVGSSCAAIACGQRLCQTEEYTRRVTSASRGSPRARRNGWQR